MFKFCGYVKKCQCCDRLCDDEGKLFGQESSRHCEEISFCQVGIIKHLSNLIIKILIFVLLNRPNMGFYKQLELFQTMEFKVEKQSAVYRNFSLENMAKQIQLGNRFAALDLNRQPLSPKDEETVNCYKCKKCR